MRTQRKFIFFLSKSAIIVYQKVRITRPKITWNMQREIKTPPKVKQNHAKKTKSKQVALESFRRSL